VFCFVKNCVEFVFCGKKDKFGRIVTSESLQLLDYPGVFALGDCSSIQGAANPATAQGMT